MRGHSTLNTTEPTFFVDEHSSKDGWMGGSAMETALIVEDDADQADLASRLVGLRRFKASVAHDGRAGLELIRSLRPDLVLLDLMLPDIDGFEVCRLVREDPRTMLTPIVMLTALSDARNRMRGYRVGANAYVTKPYSAEQLFAAIRRVQAWREKMRESKIRGEILVELRSEVTFLQEVNDMLVNVTRAFPFASQDVMHLRQALMEMGQNAIEWGNKYHVDKLVRIEYRIHSDRAEVVIRDEGSGFDRANLSHAASPDDPLAHLDVREKLGLREGGFGLMITRGMVDEVRHNEVGNEVTLIKRFQAQPPADADGEGDPLASDGRPS